MQSPPAHARHDALFLVLVSFCLLAVGAVLRGLLLWRNSAMATGIPTADILFSFVIGLRFDLVIACYTVLPLCLPMAFPDGLGKRKLARIWLGVASGIIIFLGIVEMDFYREFHTRLNSLVFQYIQEDPQTVGRMVWAGFPVVPYLLLATSLWIMLQWLIGRCNTLTAPQRFDSNAAHQTAHPTRPHIRPHIMRVIAACLLVLVFAAGGRGSVQSGPPLRWGDAFHSDHVFSNHLGLNGTFTLIKAASAREHSKVSEWWRSRVENSAALTTTREMVLRDSDQLLNPASYPLQRQSSPGHSYPPGKIRNVVVIMMESFAGAYVGSLGDQYEVTPEFDQLAAKGLLFERFFANGTHTHQGMFASLACFPNLPGHEYLMQQPEGSNEFSGLPALFLPDSDNNVYVYNGDFRWDNQEGFFRNQGMDHFIGREDITNPKHTDAVWGVSDEDVFSQAAVELEKLAANGAFYAVIQTLSNHTPFSLPEPLPMAQVTDAGNQSEHLTAMRYSDWALGEFFRTIESQPYYQETLFVIVGDHGFGTDTIASAIDLHRFHVPLLLLAPGIQEHFGKRSKLVGSQVDIVPTIMGLLGQPYRHQCWGRDLLSIAATDKSDGGFAVIKPSGSDQTAAIISGADILTLAPGMAPAFGTLTFGDSLAWHSASDPARVAALQNQLQSYIQTALGALAANRTGLPEPAARSGSQLSSPSDSSSLTSGLSPLK